MHIKDEYTVFIITTDASSSAGENKKKSIQNGRLYQQSTES